MSAFENGPAYEHQSSTSGESEKAILNYISKSLRATRPWTRLFSILGFIGTGLMILGGIALALGGQFLKVIESEPLGTTAGIIYILGSVIYLIPSIWLFKYSSAITRFLSGGGAIELGKAIAFQKSFWKFLGIVAVVMIGLSLIGIIAAIFIPMYLSRV